MLGYSNTVGVDIEKQLEHIFEVAVEMDGYL